MKNIFTIILLLVAFAGFSQSWQVNDRNIKVYEFCDDTVTDAGTISVVFPDVIYEDYDYSVQMVADSLTGSTAATAYVQQSNSTNGEHYTTISSGSQVINGVQTDKIWNGTGYMGTKLRFYVISTGTQTTRIRAWLVLKK